MRVRSVSKHLQRYTDLTRTQASANATKKIDLPCGMNVHFIKGGRPATGDFCEINLKEQRALADNLEFEAYVHKKIRDEGLRDVPAILVWNNGGSWIKPAADALKIGFQHLYVCQNPRRDERLTDCRVVIMPDESDFCFVPNYKCGYSSAFQFFRRYFASCAQQDEKISYSLNRREYMKALESDFIFSFVRHPANRFRSFYLDKLCRGPEHHNYNDYFCVYATLLDDSALDPAKVLDFISRVPWEFSDRHWKPFYNNLFHNGAALVHRIYDIESLDVFVKDASEYLKRTVEIPHERSTEGVGREEIKERLSSEDWQRWVCAVYRDDYRMYQEVKDRGGFIYTGRR